MPVPATKKEMSCPSARDRSTTPGGQRASIPRARARGEVKSGTATFAIPSPRRPLDAHRPADATHAATRPPPSSPASSPLEHPLTRCATRRVLFQRAHPSDEDVIGGAERAASFSVPPRPAVPARPPSPGGPPGICPEMSSLDVSIHDIQVDNARDRRQRTQIFFACAAAASLVLQLTDLANGLDGFDSLNQHPSRRLLVRCISFTAALLAVAFPQLAPLAFTVVGLCITGHTAVGASPRGELAGFRRRDGPPRDPPVRRQNPRPRARSAAARLPCVIPRASARPGSCGRVRGASGRAIRDEAARRSSPGCAPSLPSAARGRLTPLRAPSRTSAWGWLARAGSDGVTVLQGDSMLKLALFLFGCETNGPRPRAASSSAAEPPAPRARAPARPLARPDPTQARTNARAPLRAGGAACVRACSRARHHRPRRVACLVRARSRSCSAPALSQSRVRAAHAAHRVPRGHRSPRARAARVRVRAHGLRGAAGRLGAPGRGGALYGRRRRRRRRAPAPRGGRADRLRHRTVRCGVALRGVLLLPLRGRARAPGCVGACPLERDSRGTRHRQSSACGVPSIARAFALSDRGSPPLVASPAHEQLSAVWSCGRKRTARTSC